MRMARAVHILLLSLLAHGCGSSPPVSYFTLEPMPAQYSDDPDDALVLGIGPLRVADYLRRPQLVTRGAGAEIGVDEFNRWAEPLDSAIHSTLAMNIDGLLDEVAVVGFPDTDTVAIDYRLVGRIYRFDTDHSGLAVLEVQWRLENADGDDLMPPRRDRYEARMSRPGDSTAAAAALNQTIAQFSRDVALAVQARMPAATDG